MGKLSVLDMTQDILYAIESEPVNSISDTVESLQVAKILENVYYQMINESYWPTHKEAVQLEASTDSELPTHMRLPTLMVRIEWLKYLGENDDYADIIWMEPKDFVDMSLARNLQSDDVTKVVKDQEVIYIYNDRQPKYYTTFDDEWAVFDAYDSDLDSTLQSSKILVYGTMEPTFVMEDTHVPDMPSKAYPMYLAEAKSTAFNQLKQLANAKEETTARRQRQFLSREKFRTQGGIRFPTNFGRK